MEECTCEHASALAELEGKLGYLHRIIKILEDHNHRLEMDLNEAHKQLRGK